MKDLSETGGLAAEAIRHDTVAFLAWLRDGRLLTANPRFYAMTGFTPEKTDAMRWPADFADKDLSGCISKAMEASAHGELSCQCEGSIARKDRTLLPVTVFVRGYRSDAGELQFFAFVADSRHPGELETQLRLTQFAIDHFMDPSLWLDTEGRIAYANEATCRSLGYTREELLSMSIWDIDSACTGDRYAGLLGRIRAAGHTELESCGIARDGRRFPVEVHASLIRFGGAELVVCLVRDITERKRAGEALKESEEKFRVLSELSPAAIFMYQGDRLIYANPAAVRLTGFSAGDMLSKKFWDMVHPEYRETVKAYGKARQRGETAPSRYEVRYITRNGRERWAEFSAGRIEYRGRAAGIVTAIDITERKAAEIALREAKSQAELYVDLMGHDINNMNMAAMGFLELAGDKLRSRGWLGAEDLHLIINAMDSLQNTSQLIDSVRKLQKEQKGILQPKFICLDPILADVKERYSKVPGRVVAVTYSAICDCRVRANDLLIDVFSNIVGNAIKHSSGQLAINIGLELIEERGQQYCKVAIEDTGPGIPDKRKRDIFARAGGERARLTGRGIGLYLVKTLVDDYHGRVWVEDRVPGDYKKGARFVVLLPTAGIDRGEKADEADTCGA